MATMNTIIYIQLVFLVSVVFHESASSASNICDTERNHNKPAEDYLMTRFGQYVQLTCCVPDVTQTSVHWLKFNNATNEWTELTNKNTDFLFIEDRQVVIIQSATFDDKGDYKCKTKKNNSNQSITVRTLHLDVLACDSLARGPFAISPMPCDKTEAKTGSKVVLPCTGYFGCDAGTDMRIVQWFQTDKGEENWQEVETDEKYTIDSFKRSDGVMGSNLTIHSVKEEDFNKRFMCVLYSTQTIDGQTQLFTTLEGQKVSGSDVMTPAASPLTMAIILGTAIFISVFTFMTFTIIVCCRHRMTSDKVTKKYPEKTDRKLANDYVRTPIWTPVKTAMVQDV